MSKAENIRKQLNIDFDEQAFEDNITTINISNIRFYKLFNYMMIALLFILYFSTFFSTYATSLIPVYWFFISMSILELFFLRMKNNMTGARTNYTVIFGIIKAYTFCLFTSVIFNQNGPAITYYIFLILLPVSFLLRPKVMYLIQTLALVVFSITTLLCKPMSIASGDVLSCILFYIISLLIAGQIEKLRINNISMAATEHKRRTEMESQRDLLGVALKTAKLNAWNYDCITKVHTPTYTSEEYSEFDKTLDDMPESVISAGLIHPDSIPLIRTLYQKAQQGEKRIEGDLLLRAFHTSVFRWFHVIMLPVREKNGSICQYIGTSEDITERKNTELQYEEQLRILDSSNDSNLITKGRWNLTTNKKGLYKTNKQIGLELPLDIYSSYDDDMRILTDAIFPESKKQEMEVILDRRNLIENFRKGNDSYNFEYQRMTQDNHAIWVNMLVRICQVPGKEDIMAFGFSYDITEEVLNRSIIGRLVTVEYDFLGTIHVETGTSIVHSAQKENISLLTRLGVYQSVTDYNTSLLKAIDMIALPEEKAILASTCQLSGLLEKLSQENFLQIPFTVIERGETRRKNLGYCYLDDSQNTILYFRTDITKMYLKEQEQLRKTELALETAQNASNAKTDFFSRMSHDMRTPMNGILGLANLSEEEEDPVILKENIAKIRESGEYLLGLINDTLDFQKIESGRLTLEPRIVSTRELVENVLSLIHTTAASKQINFRMTNKSVDLDCLVNVDPMRMKQIFLNLLSNAVKFTEPGGTVEVCFECTGHTGAIAHDIITIRDTGIGMSEDFLKHKIFQPFSQEHNEVVSNYAGSGLGLSIVKKLVELMNGSIEVESQLGAGTTFTVKIDFERADYAEIEKATNNQQLRKQKTAALLCGSHLLLVEDHPLNAEIATKLLVKTNCRVDWAKNGQEGLERFLQSAPYTYDLILMDIRMPVMDGLEATRQIRCLQREDARTIPIIAMTANAYDEDVKNVLAAGMNAHLPKPIEPLIMYEMIARYLPDGHKLMET